MPATPSLVQYTGPLQHMTTEYFRDYDLVSPQSIAMLSSLLPSLLAPPEAPAAGFISASSPTTTRWWRWLQLLMLLLVFESTGEEAREEVDIGRRRLDALSIAMATRVQRLYCRATAHVDAFMPLSASRTSRCGCLCLALGASAIFYRGKAGECQERKMFGTPLESGRRAPREETARRAESR